MITEEHRNELVRQIGLHVLAISGGRVNPIDDGIELPVGSGYVVRVVLTGMDDYTVTRLFRRSGKEWIRGERTGVYFDEVGNVAYYASCFLSYDTEDWPVQP